ncbi:MAG: tRNA (adenosine(37)-N6)-threonylcarbamoyltransferase complex ATPase subunit type 1 TsaE [Muribaculaceae bacterium]|nr:tRNA (adenosine(37)-N6)-threonylcarbamoyltransferase complex ATPase subunit type 1 TsaE [Muribaculaceae bacterium]
MKEIKFRLEDIESAAKEFLEGIGEDRIFLLEGEMGSGKTTFISEVCRRLGARDDIGSPTFSIVNEYMDGDGNSIYHFDLYRIESERELLDMGAEEYFDSGNLCFIEWPDRLGRLRPDEAREVEIIVEDNGERLLRF